MVWNNLLLKCIDLRWNVPALSSRSLKVSPVLDELPGVWPTQLQELSFNLQLQQLQSSCNTCKVWWLYLSHCKIPVALMQNKAGQDNAVMVFLVTLPVEHGCDYSQQTTDPGLCGPSCTDSGLSGWGVVFRAHLDSLVEKRSMHGFSDGLHPSEGEGQVGQTSTHPGSW